MTICDCSLSAARQSLPSTNTVAPRSFHTRPIYRINTTSSPPPPRAFPAAIAGYQLQFYRPPARFHDDRCSPTTY